MKITSYKVNIFLGRQANFFIAFTLLFGAIVSQAEASGAALLHNSDNLGTKYGTWGVAGGTYGEFVCTTCHSTTTDNVKLVVESIPATIGPNVVKPVIFNSMTGFGNDAAAHTTSTQVCQVCHSQTAVHRYDKPVGQIDSNHKGANQTDCTECHSHADGFKGKGCNSCHGSTAASTNPMVSGKHSAHIADAVYGCVDCHAKSVIDDETLKGDPTAHKNTIYGDYSGARAGGSFAAGSCANVYCHTDGKGGAPAIAVNWDSGPAITDCKGCHGAGGSFGEPAYTTGNSHAKHVTVAADCDECHYVTTANGTTIKAGGSHTNKLVEVDGSSSLGFDNGTNKCSTAYCHANVYSPTGHILTPAWGSTAGCEACHTTPIGVNGPDTGSHTMHAGQACTNCHAAGTSAATAPSTGHRDGDIDTAVVTYPTNITKHAADSGYATAACSTTTCHGTGTKTWGANTTNVSCTKCHGKGTALANYSTTNAWQAAPGYATTGTDINGQTGTYTNGVSNDAQVGAHDAHLRTVNGYSDRQILCTDCHAIPASANHANGATDYSWSNLAKNIGTTLSDRGPLTPGYAASTCSTNYCHGGVLNGGNDPTPVWNDTSFLTAYAKDATNCGKCHGSPPTSGATLNYDHNAVTIASTCTGCHGHEGNGPMHIDGNLQAQGGACNACHSYDTVGGTWGSGTRLDGSVAEGWGAHAQHIDHLKALRGVTLNASTDTYGSAEFNAVCGVCHTQIPANHTMDNSSQRMINFNVDLLTYKFGPSNPLYNGVSGTPSATQAKTCSNISCHFGAAPRWQ